MKKWHMEGIITAGGRSADKLELPDTSWEIRWASVRPGKDKRRKDPSLTRYVRSAAHRVKSMLR